jgi:hypothetical protein
MSDAPNMTLKHRRQRHEQSTNTPIQLYRPPGSTYDIDAMLEQPDLTKEDVLNYLQGRPTRHKIELDPATLAYRQRRVELQDLIQQYHQGQARIDQDGRLTTTPPTPPEHPLPPLQPLHPPVEPERAWRQEQGQLAAATIARAIERYQAQGVDLNDLQLVRLPLEPPTANDPPHPTLRRICFAVLAVVTAFLCILFQTLPLFQKTPSIILNPDPILEHIAHVKPLLKHLAECPNGHRNDTRTRYEQLMHYIPGHDYIQTRLVNQTPIVDCSMGVVHIPTLSEIVQDFWRSDSPQELLLMEPMVIRGVQMSWWFPCSPMVHAQDSNASSTRACLDRCFRGVHDNVLSDQQITQIIQVGSTLIQAGHDHMDIHMEVFYLKKRLSSTVHTLRTFLRDNYGIQVEPVAFRIQAVAPMDGTGVPLYKAHSSNPLVQLIHRSHYLEYMDRAQDQNDLARYSLPWPFRVMPKRDTCHLMADMEADPQFAVHTTVFLSEGAGDDFRGGMALYVDDHPSNRHARRKIQRGLLVDGTPGRLLVSTGGVENRRCRLPMRAGIRAALQVWWNFEGAV